MASPWLRREVWRKSSQWATLTREHAGGWQGQRAWDGGEGWIRGLRAGHKGTGQVRALVG